MVDRLDIGPADAAMGPELLDLVGRALGADLEHGGRLHLVEHQEPVVAGGQGDDGSRPHGGTVPPVFMTPELASVRWVEAEEILHIGHHHLLASAQGRDDGRAEDHRFVPEAPAHLAGLGIDTDDGMPLSSGGHHEGVLQYHRRGTETVEGRLGAEVALQVDGPDLLAVRRPQGEKVAPGSQTEDPLTIQHGAGDRAVVRAGVPLVGVGDPVAPELFPGLQVEGGHDIRVAGGKEGHGAAILHRHHGIPRAESPLPGDLQPCRLTVQELAVRRRTIVGRSSKSRPARIGAADDRHSCHKKPYHQAEPARTDPETANLHSNLL